MNFLRAIMNDLRSAPFVLGWWADEAIRNLPGEVGLVLRRVITGGRFRAAGSGLVIEPGVWTLGKGKLSVGRNCRIGLGTIFQANGVIEIGDDVVIGPAVKIWSVNHIFARTDVPIYDQGYEHKPVIIGNGVRIGGNSFIMPGARIGAHAVITAGSVVSGKDVEPYSILAGNPARKVGSLAPPAPQLASTAS